MAQSQNKKKGTQNKASAAKKSSGTNTRQSPATKAKERDADKVIHQVIPYLFIILAIFLAVCYIARDATGFLGNAFHAVFFGLFSLAAWLVPLLFLNGAYFWKRDVQDGMIAYRVTFSLLCLITSSVLVHAITRSEATATFRLPELFNAGRTMQGGGVIGGLLGELLFHAFGKAGALIVSIAMLVLFLLFLFGLTPKMLLVKIVKGIRNWKHNLSDSVEETYKEEAVVLDEYAQIRELDRRARADAAAQKREKRHAVITDNYDDMPVVGENASAKGPLEDDNPIDAAIFEELSSAAKPKTDSRTEQIADGLSESEEKELSDDAPPVDFDNVTYHEAVKPVRKTGAHRLAEIERGEINLSDIFVEPAEETAPLLTSDGETTSAELDLMVEKSKLDHLSRDYGEEEELPTEDIGAAREGDYADITSVPTKHPRVSQMKFDVKPEYKFPPVQLLNYDPTPADPNAKAEVQQTATKLVETLRSFNVKTKIINVSRGPSITRYELQPEVGTKVRSIVNLVDDIALHLATSGVRIEAPIPGKEAVGIEVPNKSTATVYIRELLENASFKSAPSKVTTCLGMDVAGAPVYLDVAKMPHILIAGTTGSGKSVCINSLIISILYKAKPDEVKFILVDPKKVELNVYNGLPHLIVPVVSDPKKAAGALHWAVTEMERRYELIEGAGVRNIKGYNQSIENDPTAEKLPQIVIVIDELADLMMVAKDEVEESICRIAQKARAAGMHLVIGTQRPSVDVITGLIKANVPSRIAFTTSSQIDSRTIIDTAGAEKLIGRGDMLFAPIGSMKPIRVQGSFVSDEEVEAVTTFIKDNFGVRDYDQSVMDSIEREAQLCGNKKATVLGDGDVEANDGDPMLKPAIQLAVESGKISTSLIQRRLKLGYGRAAKLIDTMEDMGIVGAQEGQKPRSVLISKEQYMEMELRRGE